jgi:hypothetical protein
VRRVERELEVVSRSKVEEAVRDVEAREDRDPATGRFIAGNVAAGKALDRSEALWTALREAREDLVRQLHSDLALNGTAAATMEGLIGAYTEARLLREGMFIRLVELGGPVTSKGKARALLSTYLASLDRERRLALDLGLERRAKPVPTLQEYIESKRAEAGS